MLPTYVWTIVRLGFGTRSATYEHSPDGNYRNRRIRLGMSHVEDRTPILCEDVETVFVHSLRVD